MIERHGLLRQQGPSDSNVGRDLPRFLTLGPVSDRATRGNLGQHEVETYDVVDAQGQLVGTVTYTASMSLKPPFRSSYGLVQTDSNGKVVVDVRW